MSYQVKTRIPVPTGCADPLPRIAARELSYSWARYVVQRQDDTSLTLVPVRRSFWEILGNSGNSFVPHIYLSRENVDAVAVVYRQRPAIDLFLRFWFGGIAVFEMILLPRIVVGLIPVRESIICLATGALMAGWGLLLPRLGMRFCAKRLTEAITQILNS